MKKYEAKSQNVCEICGDVAKLRINKEGLVFTSCEKHKGENSKILD